MDDSTPKKHSRAPRKAQPLEAANNPDALLTPATTQTLIGVGRSTLYTLIQRGELKPIRLSARCTRFRAGDVITFLKTQAAKGAHEGAEA